MGYVPMAIYFKVLNADDAEREVAAFALKRGQTADMVAAQCAVDTPKPFKIETQDGLLIMHPRCLVREINEHEYMDRLRASGKEGFAWIIEAKG